MHSITARIGSLLAGVVFLAVPTGAEEIRGTVRDYADQSGIGGVAICLDRQCDTNPATATTDADGKYNVTVSAGKRILYFDKVSYVRRNGSRTKVIGKGKSEIVDHELMQDVVNAAYYRKAGEAYIARVHKGGAKPIAYSAQWQYVRKFAVSPANKIEMVKTIVQKDENALTAYPGFRHYQDVNANSLMEFQRGLNSALLKGTEMPTPPFAKDRRIGEELVADAVLYEIHASGAKDETKKEFLVRFGTTWGDSKAADFVQRALDKMPK